MNPRIWITVSVLFLLSIFALEGFASEAKQKGQPKEATPSLLSFVDMKTYTLVLSDPTTRTKARVDLKCFRGGRAQRRNTLCFFPMERKY